MKRAWWIVALLVWAPAAHAQDSSLGVDLHFGSKLDPTGWASLQGCDADGMSWLRPSSLRTPTGFLYGCAPALGEERVAGSWVHSGVLDLGYIQPGDGDEDNNLWQRYTDWQRGFLLGLSHFSMQRPEDGAYLDLRAIRLGDDNQFYKLNAGEAGRFKVEAFYRELPNVISANARSIWDGAGTTTLTLRDGLVAGASTPEQVAAVADAAPVQRLQFTRERAGIGLTYYLNPAWSTLINITQDERRGSRPYGGTFFFNYPFPDNGGILETVKPIDDRTVSLNAALRGSLRTWRVETSYSGSFYRSAHRGYEYQTPFSLYPVVAGAVSADLTTGQMSLEPDNDSHQLRLTLGRKLPLDGDLAITASGSRMRQNDELLPPVTCQGQFGIDLTPTGAPANPFLFDCADWNSTAALSRPRADLRIDTTMLFARLVMQPWRKVSVRADAKYRDENYRGDYIAFNPLTGSYGYVSENGSQGSVVPGEAGFWDAVLAPSAVTRIRNIPLDKRTFEAHLVTDWRPAAHDTLGATLGFTRTQREHRERRSVDASELRLTWVNTRADWVTLRANYSFTDQSGDDYDSDPYEFAYSTSLPGFVEDPAAALAHTVDAMRKYDLASRREHKVDVMATFIPAADMTLSVSARGDFNRYTAQIGRQRHDDLQGTIQWEWQPSPATSASVYYGYERAKLRFANVNDAGAALDDPRLGGLTYLDSARWWLNDEQRNHHAGATLRRSIGRVQFDAAWSFTYSRVVDSYRYASALALAWPDTADSAGHAFPAIDYRLNTIDVGLRFPLATGIDLRLFNHYERGRVSDWHYAGFADQRVYDHRVYTDGGPRSYSNNVVGLSVQIPL